MPINATLLAVLQALPSRLTSPWVFPSADTSLPLDGREYDRLVFRPALRHAKIRDFRFKDLRHTFATRLRMQARADISSIATLFGHTSTRMSERYAHADDAHLHALVRAPDCTETETPSDTKSDTTSPNQPPGDPPRPSRIRVILDDTTFAIVLATMAPTAPLSCFGVIPGCRRSI